MKATGARLRASTPWRDVHLPQGVLLCDIGVHDAPGLHRVHADPRVYAHDPSETHPHLEYTRTFLAPFLAHWVDHGFGYWTVLAPEPWWPSGVEGPRTHDDGRRIVGLGGIQTFDLEATRVLNVYFRLAPEAQGRGLGTLVLRAALACAAAVQPQLDVVVRTRPANLAARRTALRVGFADAGTVPGDTTMQLLRYRAADAIPHDDAGSTSYRVTGGSACLHL